MSVKKRGKVYYLRIRPFDGKLINVKTMAQSKQEALKIERSVLTALGSGDYRALDPASREVCVRIFKNQGWEMPVDLCDEQALILAVYLEADVFDHARDAAGLAVECYR